MQESNRCGKSHDNPFCDGSHVCRDDVCANRGEMMPAYIIARVDIMDRDQYQHYLKAVPSVIEQYGGKVIARSESPLTLEGRDEPRRIIILQFPSVARAKEFYHSPEYQEALKLREGAAHGELMVIEGVVPG
jgi:uncharacterized protein (DUF1330 family)